MTENIEFTIQYNPEIKIEAEMSSSDTGNTYTLYVCGDSDKKHQVYQCTSLDKLKKVEENMKKYQTEGKNLKRKMDEAQSALIEAQQKVEKNQSNYKLLFEEKNKLIRSIRSCKPLEVKIAPKLVKPQSKPPPKQPCSKKPSANAAWCGILCRVQTPYTYMCTGGAGGPRRGQPARRGCN